MHSFLVLWIAGTLACASSSRGMPPTMPPAMAPEARRKPVRPVCSTPKVSLAREAILDPEAPWAQGKSTFNDLEMLRRSIVQIADYYYDPSRVQPPRMLAAALEGLAAASDGALAWRDNAIIVTSTGKGWGVPDSPPGTGCGAERWQTSSPRMRFWQASIPTPGSFHRGLSLPRRRTPHRRHCWQRQERGWRANPS